MTSEGKEITEKQTSQNEVVLVNSRNTSYLNESKVLAGDLDVSADKIVYSFKVVLIGDVAVGKTSILKRYIQGDFNTNYKCNVGVEFTAKSISLGPSETADLDIWDTCGEEKFRSTTKTYFRNANGIILLFDLSDSSTFNNLGRWIDDIKEAVSEDEVSIMIVGNKFDLERKVEKEKAEKFAEEKNSGYIEVSAKTGMNVELLFEAITRKMVNKYNDELKNKNKLGKSTLSKKSKLGTSLNLSPGNQRGKAKTKFILEQNEKKAEKVPCC